MQCSAKMNIEYIPEEFWMSQSAYVKGVIFTDKLVHNYKFVM